MLKRVKDGERDIFEDKCPETSGVRETCFRRFRKSINYSRAILHLAVIIYACNSLLALLNFDYFHRLLIVQFITVISFKLFWDYVSYRTVCVFILFFRYGYVQIKAFFLILLFRIFQIFFHMFKDVKESVKTIFFLHKEFHVSSFVFRVYVSYIRHARGAYNAMKQWMKVSLSTMRTI